MTYKDVAGWFGFEEFYSTTILNYLKSGMVIAEMGVFDGKSAIFLAHHIKKYELSIKFYVIDRWLLDEEYDRFIKNTLDCNVNDYLTPIRLTSEKSSKLFLDNTFDFVFIDGSHDYQSVKNDISYWYPKVKMGGILGGDDYVECWSDVIKAVDDTFGKNILKQFPAWYIYKT
jgi:predicted O-methyltransferase YrrM